MADNRKRKAKSKPEKNLGHAELKKPRTESGKLQKLVEMPIDILFEILSMLQPIDLVQLSRTNRDFRSILMSKTSISVWKAARMGVFPAMPECPEDINEVQFAQLAFEENCQRCLQQTDTMILRRAWEARRRICNYCIERYMPHSSQNIPSLPKSLQAYVPRITTPGQQGTGHREQEHLLHEHMLQLYHKINVNGEGEQRLIDIQTAIQKHSKRCESWHRSFIQHMNDAAEKRQTIIAEYVSQTWSEEVRKMRHDDLYFHKREDVVKLCQKEFTEHTLPDLDDNITEHMEMIKTQRVSRERSELLWRRLPLLKDIHYELVNNISAKERSMLAMPGELALEPSVMNIFLNHPAETELDKSHLRPTVEAVFPVVSQRVRARIDDELFSLVEDAYQGRKPVRAIKRDTVFDLATTIFRCTGPSCSRKTTPLWYDQIISHECTRRCQFPQDVPNSEEIRLAFKEGYRSHTSRVVVYEKAFKIATQLIKLCGLDPLKTTKKMMDDLNPIFEDLEYKNNEHEGRATMTWITALDRHLQATKSESVVRLKKHPYELVEGADADVARARIAELVERRLGEKDGAMLACAQCGFSGHSSRSVLLSHMSNHGFYRKSDVKQGLMPHPDKNHVAPIFHLWPPRNYIGWGS